MSRIDVVQEKYGAVAASSLSGVQAVAEAFGYTPEQLAAIPAEANMGLSCVASVKVFAMKPKTSLGEVV